MMNPALLTMMKEIPADQIASIFLHLLRLNCKDAHEVVSVATEALTLSAAYVAPCLKVDEDKSPQEMTDETVDTMTFAAKNLLKKRENLSAYVEVFKLGQENFGTKQ